MEQKNMILMKLGEKQRSTKGRKNKKWEEIMKKQLKDSKITKKKAEKKDE